MPTPSSKEWKRARKPVQKAARKEEILAAAKRLFSMGSYDQVSLNSIAREAGMSKPNVYRYYASREEIFLHILGEEQDRYIDALFRELQSADRSHPVDEVARIWVEQALKLPDLLRLLPQLGSSLEQNSSVEQLTLFKKRSFERAAELALAHHSLYPELNPDQWGEVINTAVALMAGMWPLCNGNEIVEQAMKHPSVGLAPWDFEQKMTFALKAVILGAALF